MCPSNNRAEQVNELHWAETSADTITMIRGMKIAFDQGILGKCNRMGYDKYLCVDDVRHEHLWRLKSRVHKLLLPLLL